MLAVSDAPPGSSTRPATRPATRPTPASLYGLAVLAAIAPFDLAIPHDGWTALHLRPLMLAVIAVSVWIIFGARRNLDERVGALDAVVLVWLGIAWASAALSDVPLVGAAGAIRLTAFGLLVVATRHAVVTRAHATFVLRCLVAGAVAASVVGLIVLFAERDVFGTNHLVGSISAPNPFLRLTRPWSNPNVAAMALGATLPCVALLHRRWRLPAATLVMSALVLTYSRGAMIGLLAGAIALLVVRRTRTDVGHVATVLGIGLAVAVISPGWGARLDDPSGQNWRKVSIQAPQDLVLDPAGTTVDVTVSSPSSGTWSRADLTLSAIWVGAGQDRVWGEHRWPLPEHISAGESVEMTLDVDPSVPVGTFDVRWNVISSRGPGFFRSLREATTSRGVVFESSVEPADVDTVVGVHPFRPLDRPEIWRLSIEEFLDAPVLGVGPSELGVAVADDIGANRRFGGRHAHSLILEPLATTGVLGSTALLFMLLGAAALAVRRALRSPDPVPLAVLAGLTIALAHGLFDWPLVYTSAAVPIAVLTGIAWTWRGDPARSPCSSARVARRRVTSVDQTVTLER